MNAKRNLLTGILFLQSLIVAGQENYLIVGTYDSPKSEGIYVYKFNSNDAGIKEISHVKTSNPSFLTVSVDGKYVFAVNETADSTSKGGRVSSFSFDKKKGILSFLSQQSSGGNHPCYIWIDKKGEALFVANYSTGNLAGYKVSTGRVDTGRLLMQCKGSGPDTARQKSSHLHGIFSEGTTMYVTDLGADQIFVFPFHPKIWLEKYNSFKTQPGGGPRHMAFDTSNKKYLYLYVINELTSTIEVFSNKKYKAKHKSIQIISSLPSDHKGVVGGSADINVSPDGKFLYVSNRGTSNTIGIYSIDPKTGKLSVVDHVSCGGEKPRNFNFDPSGKFLLVANQDSNEIVIFKRDLITGLLTETGKRIPVGKPVCIKWIKTD
ncbi:MAG: lactonase family protein [Sphingobacteriales bacterium]|nr:lactonase family protein [Sphingobacteriales bacterium]